MKISESPSPGHASQRREQLLGLAVRQNGRRLVEDQDAGVAIERFQDLDPLPLADREVADACIRVDVEAELAAEGGKATRAGGTVAHQAPERLRADHDVLEHREVVGEGEVLVHHADAGVDRRRRLARRQLAAERQHAPRIGRVVAEEDVHQRRLAGTVLAKQGQQLALAQHERDPVIGFEVAEPLAYALDLEDRRETWRPCEPPGA